MEENKNIELRRVNMKKQLNDKLIPTARLQCSKEHTIDIAKKMTIGTSVASTSTMIATLANILK